MGAARRQHRAAHPCPRDPRHHRRRRSGGFTLLEMLVVGLLGVIVLTFIANAWQWYAQAANRTHVAAQLSRELKIAAETIADDFGAALAARTLTGDELQLNIDSSGDAVPQWASPDTVIEYVAQQGKLVRKQLAAATELPMADHVSTLEAEVVNGRLQVRLVAEHRDNQQDITLELHEVTP